MGLAAIASIASIAGSGASIGTGIAGAVKSGQDPTVPGELTNVPLTPRARGAQSFATRLLATGATRTPQTFQDFVRSGGQIQPFFSPGEAALTPLEAIDLGFTGQSGAIPFFDPGSQTALTPEQASFLGEEALAKGRGGARKTFRALGRTERRIKKVEGGRTKRKGKAKQSRLQELEARRQTLLGQLGVV